MNTSARSCCAFQQGPSSCCTNPTAPPPVAGAEGAVIVGKLLERTGDENIGYNAATGVFEDLVKSGVIDPMKVSWLHAFIGMGGRGGGMTKARTGCLKTW
jgi:hypothetical protein